MNATKRKATRSSLACLPCRARHLKCDGKRPSCTRCVEAAKQCNYARSRRGGLDRAALAERRKRLAVISDGATHQIPAGAQECYNLASQCVGRDKDIGLDLPTSSTLLDDETPSTASPPSLQTHVDNIEDDVLIESYYKNFYAFHPFLLPKKHMVRLSRNPDIQSSLAPLIAVMRLVGYIYSFQEWPIPFKTHVEACISRSPPTDPITVQSRLLYSIALFWHDYKSDAASQIQIATQLAIDLGMFRQGFAARHGAGDPVLEECWRRTWWMLYIVEAYYAGTLGTMNFKALNIETTVDLPCEELEYESGEIPTPKTLEEFDCHEFAIETPIFSSFTYLIGAVRCAALAISTTPKVLGKEDSAHLIQIADSVIDGWLLLLPKNRKQVMDKNGEIDELMFQAHLLIHVATVGLHRPLSDLKFNSVENISSCAREPPVDTPIPELVNVHTVRVLRSVEAQIRLLALPMRKFHHTPFTTCMVSEGTLALLSACTFIFKGKDLTIAREQIRMIIGCLKIMGEVWPRIARNVREIQTIAQHVLGLGSSKMASNSNGNINSNSSPPDSGEMPLLPSCGEEEGIFGLETGGFDIISSLESIEDLCGFYNLPSLDSAFTSDMTNGS